MNEYPYQVTCFTKEKRELLIEKLQSARGHTHKDTFSTLIYALDLFNKCMLKQEYLAMQKNQ